MGKTVIVLEELNYIFRESDINVITNMNNTGYSVEEIASKLNRDEYEIMLALLHQHKERMLTKQIQIRRRQLC